MSYNAFCVNEWLRKLTRLALLMSPEWLCTEWMLALAGLMESYLPPNDLLFLTRPECIQHLPVLGLAFACTQPSSLHSSRR